MKNLSKKILGIILVILILLSANLSIAATESELNSQKEDNQQKIEESQEKQEEIQQAKGTAMEEVNQLNTQIDSYQSQINSLDSQISEANKKIEEETNKLNEAQAKYDEQQERFNTRVVALYEMGETTYLDYLLSADSITEFLSTYYIMSEIAEADTNMLDEIENQKQEIEKAKQELENSKKELTTARADKERVSQELQNTKEQKDEYVAQLSQDEQNLQQQIEELRQANVQIDQDIAAARAEAQRRLEEQKRKEQEEANKGNNSGSSNNGGTSGSSSSGFIYPVPSAYAKITTGLYYSSGAYHGAVDFGSSGINGQPVYAVADGIVVTAKALNTSYGNYIIILHDNGLYTLYAHGQAGSIAVSQYERVKQGQQIMRVGSTGNSTGPHLHFEVRNGNGSYNNRVNPMNYLP